MKDNAGNAPSLQNGKGFRFQPACDADSIGRQFPAKGFRRETWVSGHLSRKILIAPGSTVYSCGRRALANRWYRIDGFSIFFRRICHTSAILLRVHHGVWFRFQLKPYDHSTAIGY